MCDVAALTGLAIAGLMTLRDVFGKWSTLAWRDSVIHVLSLLAFAEALSFAQPAWNHLVLLGWGSDPLTYESFSRDIVFHGPLMTLGEPIGQGAPCYYQPLYPYFHRLGCPRSATTVTGGRNGSQETSSRAPCSSTRTMRLANS